MNRSTTRLYLAMALGLCGIGICIWFFPQQFLGPLLPELIQYPGSVISIPATLHRFAYGLAISFFIWAGFALYWSRAKKGELSQTFTYLGLSAVVGSYLAMVWTLGDWMIDDAAITFAYSENLVRGHGLTLHPNLPPEEGYSNTLWMLVVALPRLFGIAVSSAGKTLCLLFGAGAVIISGWLTLKYTGSRMGYRNLLLFALVATGAPFIIWSTSGLETSIQAFLFTGVVYGAHKGDRGIWLATLCLCGLVLTRPEAPLVVASIAGLWSLHQWQQRGFTGIWKLWPIVVIPALTTIALLVFRLWYFGDPLPNPYYVKGQSWDVMQSLRGARYLLFWLLSSFTFMIIPMMFLCTPRKWSLAAYVAVAILIGQLGFLAYSGGDWMSGFRFIAPVLPVLAFLLVYAICQTNQRAQLIRRLTMLAIPLLMLGAVRQIVAFEVNPSTPITRVSALGFGFVDLAERLGIENPKLAHHDVGGTSYEARLEMVDLAGLGNRYIAKNLGNRKLIAQYVLVEKKPEFIYGSSKNPGFAAGRTRFYESRIFADDYVRVEFPGQPDMSANVGTDHLSHIRRELVKQAPGIELVYEDNILTKVIVSPKSATEKTSSYLQRNKL
jgi:hypothetical protein